MNLLKDYLIGLITVAIISAVLTTLTKNSKSCNQIIKMLCGIFMVITAISPIGKIQLHDLSVHISALSTEAKSLTEEGRLAAQQEREAIIKQQLEAYIIDKAHTLETEIQVEFTLSQDELQIPESIHIRGAVSPHTKSLLSQWIYKEFGIPEEQQQWN